MFLLITKHAPLERGEYGLTTRIHKFSDLIEAHKARNEFLKEFVHGPKLAEYLKQFEPSDQIEKLLEREDDAAKVIDLSNTPEGLILETNFRE